MLNENRKVVFLSAQTEKISHEKAFLEKHGYDVVITDYDVKPEAITPHIDVLIAHISSQDYQQDIIKAAKIVAKFTIPLLFLSSSTDEYVMEKAEKVLPDGYILKDSGELNLLSAVRTSLRTYKKSGFLSEKLPSAVKKTGEDLLLTPAIADMLNNRFNFTNFKDTNDSDGEMGALSLSDIIDRQTLQAIMDDFYKITGLGGAIVDDSGEVLVGAGWQDICKNFHRVHPETSKRCLKSDRILSEGVPAGTFKFYRCKNNMWDIVTPIELNGKHIGNIFIGQLFFEDEKIDYELYRKQARKYGFDEARYLAALDRVPRFKKETVCAAMSFYSKLAGMISAMGYSTVRLSRDIAERRRIEKSLRKSEQQYAFLAETALDLVDINSIMDIYKYTARKLYELLEGHGIVAIADFLTDHNRWKIKHFEGINTKVTKLSKIIGFDLLKMEGDISTKFYDKIISGKLVEVDFDFPALFNNKLSAKIGQRVKSILSVDKMYCISFHQNENIFGNVTIITNQNTKPLDAELIEAFINTVTIFVKKHKAEELLKKSEERYRRLAENVTDIVWIADLNLKLTYISPSIERVTGFKPELYLKIPITKSYPPASLDKIKQKLAEELAKDQHPDCDKGRTFYVEVERYHPGGYLFWEAFNAKFLRDEDGNPVAIQGVSRDISERKRFEEELRQSKEQLNTLINHSPGIIFSYIVEGKNVKITYINDNAVNILGYHQQDFINDPRLWEKSIHPDDLDSVKTALRSLNKEESVSLNRYRFKDIRGEYHWMDDRRQLMSNAGGKKEVVGIWWDVTELVNAEKEREQFRQQLIHSQKIEAIGRLAGEVAHDFNNTLSIILGYTELLLLETDESQPMYSKIMEIQKATERSSKLTRQLLSFARKDPVNFRVLNLNETIENMLAMLGTLIGSNINLNWQPTKDPWLIEIDPSQLDQILVNLCVNSRDAIDGKGTVTIETRNISYQDQVTVSDFSIPPGQYVHLKFSDDGCGMDEKTVANIFEPFFTTKRVGMGTGLGLATVYGIVKQHNGDITVDSTVGEGTAFNIFFPRTELIAPPDTGDKKVQQPSLKEGVTILVVDDEEPILEMLEPMLEILGFKVLTSNKPADAIQLFKQIREEVSLLLTDVMMPEINGMELANRLQEIKPGLKVLFMSGYSDEIISQQGKNNRTINFIHKPLSMKMLQNKIADLLN